ncbi:MAG: hypothetical protein IPH23_14740 [Gammaproteobacteria bacterium]|nr:hypothetical protein [Gammaproteobacteria bacterium]
MLRACRAPALDWVEDESNAHLDFDRNFLRHCVLPTLTAPDRMPWRGSSRVAAKAKRPNWAWIWRPSLNSAGSTNARNGFGRSLSLAGLTALATHRQRSPLRHWLLPGVGDRRNPARASPASFAT